MDVDVYDVDLYLPKDRIEALKREGKKIICYFSAGSREDFRLDDHLFPKQAMGGVLRFAVGDQFEYVFQGF